jgi:cell wall assembly regulator SMI1
MEDSRLGQLWQRIEASVLARTSSLELPFASGATERAIDAVEDVLGIRLPEDVRATYRRHNGGFSLDPVIAMDMLPLTEMAELWRILEDLLHDEQWATQPPYYFTDEVVRSGHQAGPVQPVWWHRRWIPFASELAGNITCIDLAPAAGGTVGQIIDWDHECGPTRVLYSSFESFLSDWADQLERHDHTLLDEDTE